MYKEENSMILSLLNVSISVLNVLMEYDGRCRLMAALASETVQTLTSLGLFWERQKVFSPVELRGIGIKCLCPSVEKYSGGPAQALGVGINK